MSHKVWFAVAFFFVAVLIFTKLDFLVNSDFYGYGLTFSYGWYREYTILYMLLFQLVILPLSLWIRNWYFLGLTEAFVLSGTQDLIYFGLWQGSFPKGDWSWMIWSDFFGTWTTANQFTLCILVNGLVFGFCGFQWIIWNHNLKIKQ